MSLHGTGFPSCHELKLAAVRVVIDYIGMCVPRLGHKLGI